MLRLARSTVAFLTTVVSPTLAWAQGVGAQDGGAVPNAVGLQPFDWVLIAIYAASTIGLGLYFSRRQVTTQEYFVGSGAMNPVLIGISLFATLLSTISYLSMPGECAGKGPAVLSGLFALPLVYFVVSRWLLPAYMRQRVTSAYELLEERLGISVRLLGASLFLVLRLVWMMLLVYLAAKAMIVMLGVDERWIPWIVLGTGIVSVAYTSLGGLRAVVVTDCLQTVLLLGGALLVLATVTYDFGGFGWFPTEWQPTWDVQPLFSLDPKTRVTVLGSIVSVSMWYIATYGGDQTSVQRFMATKDITAARRALRTNLTVGVIVQLTLYLVGFALLGYFMLHRDQLPGDGDLRANADSLFPRYISYHLPVGVSGLVVSAMFAAAMSSIDSGVNSITAVVMTDFVGRSRWSPKTPKGHLRCAQLLALVIGGAVVLGSSQMKYVEGNFSAITNKVANSLTTPIFALFFFAMFVRRATPLGVWVGAICGVVVAVSFAFSGPLVYLLHTQFGVDPAVFNVELITKTNAGETWTSAEDPISFQWIGPAAFTVNVLIGTLVSYLLPGKRRGEGEEGRDGRAGG
jgi:SSS family solute:Na+ symporter